MLFEIADDREAEAEWAAVSILWEGGDEVEKAKCCADDSGEEGPGGDDKRGEDEEKEEDDDDEEEEDAMRETNRLMLAKPNPAAGPASDA